MLLEMAKGCRPGTHLKLQFLLWRRTGKEPLQQGRTGKQIGSMFIEGPPKNKEFKH
jgi:hypothetical protein